MTNELNIVSDADLTSVDKEDLNTVLDRIIIQHKQNRQDINKLVFESIAALTEADIAQSELSNKGFFKRLLGNFTGSNQKLQNKINTSKSISQYASQQILQKLAEQNLMSFQLIASVINKLNMSILDTNKKINDIYVGLRTYFNSIRSEMIQIGLRLTKLEQNMNLVYWDHDIGILMLNDTNYSALTDAGKIVCITRDFFDITGGNYGLKEQNFLKVTMSKIGLNPEQRINRLQVIEEISSNDEFKYKLLDGKENIYVERPDIYVSFGLLSKIEKLNGEESYITSSMEQYLLNQGINPKKEDIIDTLASNYMKQLNVDPDNDVKVYDFVLELLFNLESYEELNNTQNNIKELEEAEENESNKKSFQISEYTIEGNKFCYGDGVDVSLEEAEKYFKKAADSGDLEGLRMLGVVNARRENYSEALRCYEEAANKGYKKAKSNLAACYFYGEGVAQDKQKGLDVLNELVEKNEPLALRILANIYCYGEAGEQYIDKSGELYKKAIELGDTRSLFMLGILYYYGKGGVSLDYDKAFGLFDKAVQSHVIDGSLYFAIGRCYLFGKGVEKNDKIALEWFEKAAKLGHKKAKEILEEQSCEYVNILNLSDSDISSSNRLFNMIKSKLVNVQCSGKYNEYEFELLVNKINSLMKYHKSSRLVRQLGKEFDNPLKSLFLYENLNEYGKIIIDNTSFCIDYDYYDDWKNSYKSINNENMNNALYFYIDELCADQLTITSFLFWSLIIIIEDGVNRHALELSKLCDIIKWSEKHMKRTTLGIGPEDVDAIIDNAIIICQKEIGIKWNDNVHVSFAIPRIEP